MLERNCSPLYYSDAIYSTGYVSHLYADPKVISILNLWNHELDPRFYLREVRTEISGTDCVGDHESVLM